MVKSLDITHVCILLGLTMTLPAAAQGEQGPPLKPTAGGASEQEPAQVEEARSRFRRALDLYDEGNYEAALLEFQRAYELAPHPQLFYNIGKVADKLRDYPAAYDAFTKYLTQTTDDSPEIRREVEESIRRLEDRTGLLTLRVNVRGASITIDDERVFTAPVDEPIRISSGRHAIRVAASGYWPQLLPIEVVGKDRQTLEVTLDRSEASRAASAPDRTSPRPPDTGPQRKPLPWVWYGVAGGLATATIVTGLITNSKASQYKDLQADPSTSDPSKLDDEFDNVRMWSITTDILLGGTVVAAGVAAYKTLAPSEAPREKTVAALSWSGGNNVQVLVSGPLP